MEYKEKRTQQIKNMGIEIVNRKNKEVDIFGKMKKKLASLERREFEIKINFKRITSEPSNALIEDGAGRSGSVWPGDVWRRRSRKL